MRRVPRNAAFPKAAAFHEAGHAVARLHIGAPATAVAINRSGGGYTRGTPNRWPGRGQRRMWTWLLVLFAGSYAQALAEKRSLHRTLITSGKLDLQQAKPAIDWLVDRGHARRSVDVLTRIHFSTCAFLTVRWDAIERVAIALMAQGRLTARQVRALVE
jgi:hypothetical protein